MKYGYYFYKGINGVEEYVPCQNPSDAITIADTEWRRLSEEEQKEYKQNNDSVFGAVTCEIKTVKGHELPDLEHYHMFHNAMQMSRGRIYFDLEKIATKTYNFGTDKYGTWLVDVVETENCREAWLYLSNMGIKTMIHGEPYGQGSCYDFLITIRCCIEDEKRYYLEDYEPELLDEE